MGVCVKRYKVLAGFVCLSLLIVPGSLQAQHDRGPRGGAAGAGGALPNLKPEAQSLFDQALMVFQEVQSVSGDVEGEDSSGLGPTFNGNSCAMCHTTPAIGGTSPSLNPQVALATLHRASNILPSFITPDCPIRDARYRLGIGGRFNTSGNDGTITRFGWKAQNKSLLVFAGEAYNVEQGVTNEAFPDERAGVDGCVFNPLPEDASGINNEGGESPLSDTVNFAVFMRLTAAPAPAPETASTLRGSNLF